MENTPQPLSAEGGESLSSFSEPGGQFQPPDIQSVSENRAIEVNSADPMTGVSGNPAQTHGVFGSSSAGSFMRQIHTAINARYHPSEFPAHGNLENPVVNFPGDHPPMSYEKATLFVLPPKELGDSLMQAYWEFEWTLYPVVDRHHVKNIYKSLWVAGNGCSLTSMGIVNLCFALGCHYCQSLPLQERKSTGQTFFDRAERLYRRSRHSPSLEMVQLLLLLGLYLQSTSDVFRCWMIVGEAIRMAQSLGIYLPHDSLDEPSGHVECKRRIWHGCVWLDR